MPGTLHIELFIGLLTKSDTLGPIYGSRQACRMQSQSQVPRGYWSHCVTITIKNSQKS